ncbi:MAG: PQQ-like beta-propeller repeat protein [Planctomycetaceae bacterium]|nr:PQQ-like beta-propeller repeat protein [Planctomycetaceae bacterium]
MKSTVSCLCVLLMGTAGAADWPTWRGTQRDGISTESGLLDAWPEGGPEVIWTSSDAGIGYSSFAVVGDRLFTMGADDDSEYVMALDAKTGKQVWSTPVGERLKNGWGDGPRSTPTYVDGLIVAIGGRGGVVCCSAEDGAVKWKADLTDLGGSVPFWGYSESPLIDGDRVLVTPGGDQGTVVCFDLKSGDKIWQSSDMTEKAHYSSIIAVDHFGKRQYIQLTMKKVFGLDADGRLMWQADWPGGRTAVIPTPIYRSGSVYITSGYGAGCMLLAVDAENNVEQVYDNKVMKNHHGGVILVGDHIYGYSDGPGWVCQDLQSGEMVWNEKRKLGKGAVAFADGMFYCLDERSGTCALISASPEGWQEHGRVTISPQTEQRAEKGKIWTHPVIADGRLYLRDQEVVVCYQIRQ